MNLAELQAYAHDVYPEEVNLLRTLARIPAPSGQEEHRARFVASWLRDAGAAHVEIDEAKNVLCWLGEAPDAGVEVFSAHTDVVFDDLTELPLREEGPRMYAPGVGDDTANLVGLLMATRYLLRHPEHVAARSLLVVANSGEEGLGNLRGTKAVYERFGARVLSHVAFDLYLGSYVSEAVGSHRWRVCCDTSGGHSYKDFGKPNAIAKLAGLIGALEAHEPPHGMSCTHNVGRIEGGTTINSIASHAEMLWEHRSQSEECLGLMRETFERTIAARQQDGVRFSVELLGERPATGTMSDRAAEAQAHLEERARRAQRLALGDAPITHAPASTDINVPLSLGIPAVCVGAVRGAELHTRDEWIETESLKDGLVVILSMMAD